MSYTTIHPYSESMLYLNYFCKSDEFSIQMKSFFIQLHVQLKLLKQCYEFKAKYKYDTFLLLLGFH